MKTNFKKRQAGFTLIEMLVAVAIFVVVAIVVTGALMIVVQSYRKAQTAKLVIDNLNFAMDQMTLDLREGTEYQGFNWGVNNSNYPDGVCYDNCTGVSLRSRDGDLRNYTLAGDGSGNYRIWMGRNCDAGGCASSFGMTDQQVRIIRPGTVNDPGFTLRFIPSLDQTDFAGHRKIIISINGEVLKGGEKTLYHLQSTVSQRNL